MNKKIKFPSRPYAPVTSKVMQKYDSLAAMRDAMTNGAIDTKIEDRIESIIEKWKVEPNSVQPYIEMRDVLEETRAIPPSNERIDLMNSILRTIGKPTNLATYLDMLRYSSKQEDTKDQQLCKNVLQNVKLHSIYGWCGNTLLVESFNFPTEGTHQPIAGLGERLGNSPSAWNLTIHIWQPNKNAKGFTLNKVEDSNTILEPPHTHPFDFVSLIVKGQLHQSIYSQNNDNKVQSCSEKKHNHYEEIALEHVDGVWPPHDYQEKCYLTTKEHRVLLKEGDSYYMPCDWIHDVEIDGNLAKSKPTITLFLSSEYLVMPHVYMDESMAIYHEENPKVKLNGKPIPENNWHKKLKLIADYLRGDTETMNLNDVVDYDGEYAFFHRV